MFAAHLSTAQGAKTILELKAEGAKPAFSHSYGALALCGAGVNN